MIFFYYGQNHRINSYICVYSMKTTVVFVTYRNFFRGRISITKIYILLVFTSRSLRMQSVIFCLLQITGESIYTQYDHDFSEKISKVWSGSGVSSFLMGGRRLYNIFFTYNMKRKASNSIHSIILLF